MHSPRRWKGRIALFWWHWLSCDGHFSPSMNTKQPARAPCSPIGHLGMSPLLHPPPASQGSKAISASPLGFLGLWATRTNPKQQETPRFLLSRDFCTAPKALQKTPGYILPGRFPPRLLETKSYQNLHSNATQMTHYSPKNNRGEISN